MQILLQVISQEGIDLLQQTLEGWQQEDRRPELLTKLQKLEQLRFLYERLVNNLNPVPFRSLMRIIMRFEVNLILIEHPYLDLEFWDSYAHFHSRSFSEQQKRGWRLHFFHQDGTSPPDSLVAMLYDGKSQQELAERGFSYFGFATVRPTSSFNLGRVAVPFDNSDHNGCAYLKGQGSQSVNVAGSVLSIETVPFIQQDPVAGTCATASVWVASQILGTKFDLHKYPYLAITRHAVRGSSVGAGMEVLTPEYLDHGLTVPEISNALSITGAVPQSLVVSNIADYRQAPAIVRDLLYSFVESELPVIVCLKKPGEVAGHAITVIGHYQNMIGDVAEIDRCALSCAYQGGSDQQFLVSQTVNRFYAHDDRYGPFNRIEFPADRPQAQGIHYCPVYLKEGKSDEPKLTDISALVVPLPPYVRNNPRHVMQDAWVRFFKVFGGLLKREDKVLWRTFLIKGSQFKQSLWDRYPYRVARKYSEKHLPRYVWLCEISVFQKDHYEMAFNVDPDRPRPVRGEFLYDTTTAFYEVSPIVQRFKEYFVTDHHSDKVLAAQRQAYLEQFRISGLTWEEDRACFASSRLKNRG